MSRINKNDKFEMSVVRWTIILVFGAIICFIALGSFKQQKKPSESQSTGELLYGEDKGAYPKLEWKPNETRQMIITKVIELPGTIGQKIAIAEFKEDKGKTRPRTVHVHIPSDLPNAERDLVGMEISVTEVKTCIASMSGSGFWIMRNQRGKVDLKD